MQAWPNYCLARAVRERQQALLRDSASVALQQDVRGNRFLLRFKTCSSDEALEVMSGTMALSRYTATPDSPGAQAVRKALLKGIESFCTDMEPPAYNSSRLKFQGKCDMEFFKDIVRKVECLAADAASDEQCALREIVGFGGNVKRIDGALAQCLPNVKAGWFVCAGWG